MVIIQKSCILHILSKRPPRGTLSCDLLLVLMADLEIFPCCGVELGEFSMFWGQIVIFPMFWSRIWHFFYALISDLEIFPCCSKVWFEDFSMFWVQICRFFSCSEDGFGDFVSCSDVWFVNFPMFWGRVWIFFMFWCRICNFSMFWGRILQYFYRLKLGQLQLDPGQKPVMAFSQNLQIWPHMERS